MTGDERGEVWEQINLRVAQHERQGWKLLWRKDDPPRARMRIVVNPKRLPVRMMIRTRAWSRRVTCCDIFIEDGQVVSRNVDDCNAE